MITRSAVDTQMDTDVKDVSYECNQGDNMWYFDALEENHKSGPLIYRYLVNQAKKSICIWDPYLNRGDAVLLKDISKEVDIKILTTFGVNVKNQYSQTFQDFLDESNIYQKACGYGLEIRFLNGRNVQNLDRKPFHDRYLFVDDKIFNVGASLTYHTIENEIDSKKVASTSIHKVVSKNDKVLITKKFNACWNHEYTEVVISEVGDRI